MHCLHMLLSGLSLTCASTYVRFTCCYLPVSAAQALKVVPAWRLQLLPCTAPEMPVVNILSFWLVEAVRLCLSNPCRDQQHFFSAISASLLISLMSYRPTMSACFASSVILTALVCIYHWQPRQWLIHTCASVACCCAVQACKATFAHTVVASSTWKAPAATLKLLVGVESIKQP